MKKSINRCPSCGGRCLVEEYCWSGDMWNTYSYAVNCKKCKVRGPEIEDSIFDCNANKCKQKAIDLWNEMTATCPKSFAKPPVTYADSTLPEGVEPATEKQMKLAKWMSDVLDKKLPIECSKENVRIFIAEHMDKFKKEVAKQKQHSYSYTFYADDENGNCWMDDRY